jgi:DNA-directed RNA polymerase specialized sigma24 family protein
MDIDTDLSGAAAYPVTRCSVVLATGNPDAAVRKQAFETLVNGYWKPVYTYIRIRWSLSNEDAKDRTQAFFTAALEKGFFAAFDSSKARFRTFLRVCVDRFVANDFRAANRQKRGDGAVVSLDFVVDGESAQHPAASELSPDELFRREWVRELFGMAVDDLQRLCLAAGKELHFRLFQRYDLEGPEAAEQPTYARLGEEFGLPVTQVTNYLAVTRRQFRDLVIERIRDTTGSDDEFHDECRSLFGSAIP